MSHEPRLHPVEDRPPPRRLSEWPPYRNRVERQTALLATVAATLLLAVRFLAVPVAAAPAASYQFTPQAQTAPEDVASSASGAEDPLDQVDAAPDQPSPEQEQDDGSSEAATPADDQDGEALPSEEDSASEGRQVTRVEPSSRGGSRSPDLAPEPTPTTGELIVAIALEFEGYPYRWGGARPETGFDCSGFTGYVYREAGFAIPAHDLRGQLNAGQRVERDQLQPGDLVFFQNTYVAGLSHSGIYVGNNRFISAVEPGVGVAIASMSTSYWAPRFFAASRPW